VKNKLYEEVKRRIVLLDYEPGRPLREKELAEEFGMSRTPVRETLIRLETEGLVRIIPNSGVYVSEIRLQNLKNVFEIRGHLIRLAGRLAADRITPQELTRIKDQVEKIGKENAPHRLMQLDSELHVILNKATKNELLAKTLEMLRNQAVRIWTFSRDECCNTFHKEFVSLVAALEAKDADRCEKILVDHAKGFVDRIRDQL
jgi:DNA-binding GntR family transcriptional regulator